MKKHLLMAAALAALSAFAATDGTKIATQDWVVRKLKEAAGVRISTATVTTNADSTVTYYSAHTSSTVTNMVGLSFTFATNSFRFTSALYANSLERTSTPFLSFLFGTAYADVPTDNYYVTMTVKSGSWYQKAGSTVKEHKFNFGSGLTLTCTHELPSVPSSTHTCVIDTSNHCNCKMKDNTTDNVTTPDEYADWTNEKLMTEFGVWENWATGSLSQYITEKESGSKTRKYVTDDDGSLIPIDEFDHCDAWYDALTELLKDTINTHMQACRDAYITSQICDQENPQHTPETKTCATTWQQCSACGDVISGTKSHSQKEWRVVATTTKTVSYTGSCTCGEEKETKTHTHEWVNCAACALTLPDGQTTCGAACAYCNGNHNFTGSDKPCHACTCDNCNVTSTDISYHTGWHECSSDDETDNDDGTANGGHCACDCGKFGHNAGTAHAYGGNTYGPATPVNDVYHWVSKYCIRSGCGHHHATREEHPYELTGYEYIDDDICRWKYKCKTQGCGHTKNEDTHDHAEEDAGYEDVSETVCRHKWKCKNCLEIVRTADESHHRGANCKCDHEGCGRQLPHVYITNECENVVCQYCNAQMSGTKYLHNHYRMDGTSPESETHTCACGESTLAHNWGEWYVYSTTDTTITYRRLCDGETVENRESGENYTETFCLAYQEKTEPKNKDPDVPGNTKTTPDPPEDPDDPDDPYKKGYGISIFSSKGQDVKYVKRVIGTNNFQEPESETKAEYRDLWIQDGDNVLSEIVTEMRSMSRAGFTTKTEIKYMIDCFDRMDGSLIGVNGPFLETNTIRTVWGPWYRSEWEIVRDLGGTNQNGL